MRGCVRGWMQKNDGSRSGELYSYRVRDGEINCLPRLRQTRLSFSKRAIVGKIKTSTQHNGPMSYRVWKNKSNLRHPKAAGALQRVKKNIRGNVLACVRAAVSRRIYAWACVPHHSTNVDCQGGVHRKDGRCHGSLRLFSRTALMSERLPRGFSTRAGGAWTPD